MDGKPWSRFKDFGTYSAAKREGDKTVADLAKGKASALSPGQAADALNAFEELQRFYQATGKRLSLRFVAAEYCEALRKSNGRTLAGMVDGFLTTVATVKRMDLLKAVDEWIASRKPRTVAQDGKRPQLSPGYHYNVSMWAQEFAKTFPGHAVCDLSKEHIDRYIANHTDVGPKSRNERRNVVRMFLTWAVKKDYLGPTHRLLEADRMAREIVEPEEIEPYTADELQSMLNRAGKRPKPAKKGKEPEADYRPLLPMIALVGLGGVRLQEAARMTWEDVWHVEGHIEVPAGKSKTRSRRLATMPDNLRQWLEPYQDSKGSLWEHCLDHFHRPFAAMLAELKIPARRNGLRHGFVSAHYALHSDEGLTAKESGNSPAMVHKNYKALMTKKQGEAWFAVRPAKSAKIIRLSTAAKA